MNSTNKLSDDNPRQEMWELTNNFPSYLNWLHVLIQSYFDWVTGYYLLPPLWKSNSWLELLYGLLQYFGGAIICLISLDKSEGSWLWFAFIPVGWISTIAGMTQLQEVAHFCAHNVFVLTRKNSDHE